MSGPSARLGAFTTPRLTAEPLNDSHLGSLVALHLDEAVSRYIGGVRTPEVTRAYLATNIAHWSQHGFGLWILHTPGRRPNGGAFVGRAGLRHVTVNGAPEVEIAYALDRPFWGQGLASEITQALIQIGLEQLRLPSIVGVVVEGHTASCHVLEKAGFAFEGKAIFHGADCVVYRLSAPQVR